MTGELSIGDLVSRTGVQEPTLRIWERRHDFPRPDRTRSGHRRYSEEHVEQVQRVLAGRRAGLSLKAAIARAQRTEATRDLSLFATVRRHVPHLQAHLIAKPAMIALSHAIEDESLALAERHILFGCFQREEFYRQAQPRWRELSQGAVTAVFAAFERPASPEHGPAEIPIAGLAALTREWAIVSYGPRSAICLVGREPASSSVGAASTSRAFETVWTVDPGVVCELARACSRAACTLVPDVGERAEEILALEPVAGADEQLRLATSVINRTLSRLR